MENNKEYTQNAREERKSSGNAMKEDSEKRINDDSIGQDERESGKYEPAIEDTMIGHDGDDSNLNLNFGDGKLNTENTLGEHGND